MFKIESYITPIILTYLEKYVRDFKTEDAQVSLWSGGVALYNLVLKPDVIQKEFNLPFYITSGKIHELLINIPWMKIVSEPIVVTINAMECVVMLKEVAETSSYGGSEQSNSQNNAVEAPPNYATSIINKIVNNITIQCHSLILKYIEEDIVVSVNIKHMKLESTNGEWKAMFSDINPVDLALRKCLKLTNLTLCLDKMNSDGNIPYYQEPLLNHCDLEIRVLNKYQTTNCKRPLYSHMTIISDKLEFSVSFQQLPMFYRILLFIKALNRKELKVRKSSESNRIGMERTDQEYNESWAQWAWSFVPSVGSVFVSGETVEQVEREQGFANFLMTTNVEHLSFTFKVPEPSLLHTRKNKQRPIWELSLSKIVMQSSGCGNQWFSLRAGFDSATLSSEGPCVCDHADYYDNVGDKRLYMLLGNSLKEQTGGGSCPQPNEPVETWPLVFKQVEAETVIAEEQMKKICPGFAIQFTNVLWIPDEIEPGEVETYDGDFEYSNFEEQSRLHVVVGNSEITLSTGFIHRFTCLMDAFDRYDYAPYKDSQTDLPPSRLPSLSVEEMDALMNTSKQLIVKVLCFKPCIKIPACDHKNSEESLQSVHQKKDTYSSHLSEVLLNVPAFGFDAAKIEINFTTPLYPKRLVYAACQMSPPHPYLWKECHSNTNLIIDKLTLFVLYKGNVKIVKCRKLSQPSTSSKKDSKSVNKHKAIIAQTSLTMTAKLLLKPSYFTDNEPLLKSYTLSADELMFCSSMPRLLTTCYLILSAVNLAPAHDLPLCTTSIIQDSIKDSSTVHVDITLEGILLRLYDTENTHTFMFTMNSVRVLAIKPDFYGSDRQAWIISAPDRSSKSALLRMALQYADVQQDSSLNYFGLWSEPSSFCMDPLIAEWFTYAPLIPPIRVSASRSQQKNSTNLSSKRSLDETVHSSGKMVRSPSFSQELSRGNDENDSSFVYSNLRKRGKSMNASRWSQTNLWESSRLRETFTTAQSWCVNLETGLITVYFPADTVPTLGKSTLEDALDKYVTEYKSLMPAVMVYSFGVLKLQSASSRQSLWALIQNDGPTFIRNPAVIETLKNSFPWKMTITDMSCCTIAKKPATKKSLLKQATKPTPLLHLTTISITISLVVKPKRPYDSFPGTGTTTPKVADSIIDIKHSINHKNLFANQPTDSSVFGLCVHIDTTPIVLTFSETQILLIARVVHGLTHLVEIVVRNIEYLMTIQRHVALDEFNEDSMLLEPSFTELDSAGDLSSEQQSSSLLLIFENFPPDSDWKITFWLQWVVSRVTIKCFAVINTFEYKLVFDSEDIILTYDGQQHYSKLKLKISSLSIKHFRRFKTEWVPGDFSGIVLRGHESGSRKIREGFLTLTLTTASAESVRKQWQEEFKSSIKVRQKENIQFPCSSIMTFADTKNVVQEIQLSLQSLDVILSGAVLHKFVDLFKPFYTDVCCPEGKADKNGTVNRLNIEALKSDNFPLFYFDCSQIGIIMPVRNLVTSPEHEMDAIVVEIGSIMLSPHPENPICRKPLDNDIYQSAARSNILFMPGSSLEDRQYQLGIKNLVVHMSNWEIISEKFPKYNLTENPACFWQFESDEQTSEVIVQLELSAVVALAMMYEHKLVCPPAIEFNIVSDVFAIVCTTDINVFRELLTEVLRPSCNEANSESNIVVTCPYYHYFHSRVYSGNTSIKRVMIEATTRASDSGVESIYSVPMTALKAYSKHVSIVDEKPRDTSLEYFELYFTAGKVWLNIYHCEQSVVRSLRSRKERKIGYTPLIYFELHQPNVFVSKAHNDWKLRMSLFDMTFSVGGDECESYPDFSKFRSPLLATERGDRDPFTGIPPALVSIEIEKVHMKRIETVFLMERPIQFALSKYRLYDMQETIKLLHLPDLIVAESVFERDPGKDSYDVECEWIRFLMRDIDEVQITTTQIVFLLELPSDHKILFGFDGINATYMTSHRPDKVVLKLLGNGMSMSDGTNYIIKPNTLGVRIQATWEAWQRHESNWCYPMLYILFECENLMVEIIPELAQLIYLFNADFEEIKSFIAYKEFPKSSPSSVSRREGSQINKDASRTGDESEMFYKDDLRIGTFKMLKGGQLPMAYQVTVDKYCMTWRYPHPRAITRIISFPIPTQDSDIVNCVLEYYSETMEEFCEYVYFDINTETCTKLELNTSSPRIVFAASWRVRILGADYFEHHKYSFVFNRNKYSIKKSNSEQTTFHDHYHVHNMSVEASALAPALRIDSYFSPLQVSRTQWAVRSSKIIVNLHNAVYKLGEVSGYDGYYLSKTFQKNHPMLSFMLHNAIVAAQHAPRKKHYMIGWRFDASIGVQEPHSFSMGEMLRMCLFNGTYWKEKDSSKVLFESEMMVWDLPLDRMVMIENVLKQWQTAFDTDGKILNQVKSARLSVKYIFVNKTDIVLRIGQDMTTESILLTPETKYAYRWYNNRVCKNLRIATARGDWFWSKGFCIDNDGLFEITLDPQYYACDLRLWVKVGPDCDAVTYKVIEITGRFLIWNMLPIKFLFTIQETTSYPAHKKNPIQGTLNRQCLALTSVAANNSEVTLKLKILQHAGSWSGEIPLKECPKKNIPWLVKIPCSNVILDYISIWCQVTTNPVTKRVLVSLWPLYIIRSHLPFNTDMHVTSEDNERTRVVPITGQGQESQFFTAGTTATKHRLSFSFSGLQVPAISSEVPLHYGVLKGEISQPLYENPDFEKIQEEFNAFLNEDNLWPYSDISGDITRKWVHSLSQPNVDVIVSYKRVPISVTVVMHVAPWGLFVNSSETSLTLRGQHLGFVCELTSGNVLALPRTIAKKEFYLTIDEGQNLWASPPLRVSEVELGPYGKPAPGVLHLDHSNTVAIVAKDKLVVIRLFYNIKDDINIFGAASNYVLTNYLDMLILVNPVAIPCSCDFDAYKHPSFQIQVPPKNPEINEGVALTKFQMTDLLTKPITDLSSVRLFLQFSLPSLPECYSSKPINLNEKTKRMPVVLRNGINAPIACVVTYTEHQGRGYVGIHYDPSPQFLVCNNTTNNLVLSSCDETTKDSPNLVKALDEKWFCLLEPGTKTFYSTPSYSGNFPEYDFQLQPSCCNLLLAHTPKDKLSYPDWSAPMCITQRDSEIMVQLNNPFLEVKVTIQAHLHNTILTIEHVNAHEISASEVRDRLQNMWVNENSEDLMTSGEDSDTPRRGILRENASFRLFGSPQTQSGTASPMPFANLKRSTMILDPTSDPTTPLNLSKHKVLASPNAESQSISMASSIIMRNNALKDEIQSEGFNSNVVLTLREEKAYLQAVPEHVRFVIQGIQISVGDGYKDLIRITADHIIACMHRYSNISEFQALLQIGDIQIDNPLYLDGGFDFPVVLVNTTKSRQMRRTAATLTPPWNTFVYKLKAEEERQNCVLLIRLFISEWKVHGVCRREISAVNIKVGGVSLYLEDSFISSMVHLVSLYHPVDVFQEEELEEIIHLVVPEHVASEALDSASPLTITKLSISEIPLILSLRTNVRLYLALDHSPLQLEAYQRYTIITTPFRLGHTIAMYYLSGCIVGAGWVVGSLEILGSPGTLARRVGVGLRDLVLEPWRGLSGGPKSLMIGAKTGAASLAKNVAGGAVSSVSLLCGSVARNLDMMACDDEHARRAADLRRRRPDSLLEGLGRGLSGLFVTLLGAIGGIAHHPLISLDERRNNVPVAVATGFTKGIIGAVAKPLSATADLVALAGRGLLSQTGWDSDCQIRPKYVQGEFCQGARERTRWTFLLVDLVLKHAMHATRKCDDGNQQEILLLITKKWLILIDRISESVLEMIDVKKFFGSVVHSDGSLEMFICDTIKSDEELTQTLDRIDAMARVAAYAAGATSHLHSLGPGTRKIWLLMSETQAHYANAILQACRNDALKSHFTMCSDS